MASDAWKSLRVAGTSALPRKEHTATYFMGKIYIFGGLSPAGEPLPATITEMDTGGLKAWGTPNVTGVSPGERHGHSATLVDKAIFYFGGISGKLARNDLFALRIVGTQPAWQKPRITGTSPPPRAGHSSVLLGKDQLVVFGGSYLVKSFNDVHVYSVPKGEWVQPS